MAPKKSTKKGATSAAQKKSAPKKAVKQTPPKESAAAKKAAKKPAKKAPVKPGPTDKPATGERGLSQTSVLARVDVGFGNNLYIRGEGDGLSWDRGAMMENLSPYEWAFRTHDAPHGLTFKFLINDEEWAEGENLTVPSGGTSISSPTFGA